MSYTIKLKNMKTVGIGEVEKALDEGKRAQRLGWNGRGMFVYKQREIEIPISVIPNMTSLSPEVKAEFMDRGLSLKFKNQYAIVDFDNNINSWSASSTDLAATDWIILD